MDDIFQIIIFKSNILDYIMLIHNSGWIHWMFEWIRHERLQVLHFPICKGLDVKIYLNDQYNASVIEKRLDFESQWLILQWIKVRDHNPMNENVDVESFTGFSSNDVYKFFSPHENIRTTSNRHDSVSWSIMDASVNELLTVHFSNQGRVAWSVCDVSRA